jgi:hypothetical protein
MAPETLKKRKIQKGIKNNTMNILLPKGKSGLFVHP